MYNGLISIVVGLVILFFNKSMARKLYEGDMRLRRIKSVRKRLHEGDMQLQSKKTDDYSSHSKRYRITTIALGLVFVTLGCLDVMSYFQ